MLKSESSWNLVSLPTSNIKGGWKGHAKSSGIRLGRGTTYLVTQSYIKNQPTSWSVHLQNHSWCWDKPRATRTHLTHHGPDSGEATIFPHIVFSALLCCTHIRMAFCPGWRTPKFLVRPKRAPTMLKNGSSRNLVPLPTSSTKGGWKGRAKSSGIRLGRRTTYLVTQSCIKNQPTS
jgi:hypothetical protein